jgi:hypothetical protein
MIEDNHRFSAALQSAPFADGTTPYLRRATQRKDRYFEDICITVCSNCLQEPQPARATCPVDVGQTGEGEQYARSVLA